METLIIPVVTTPLAALLAAGGVAQWVKRTQQHQRGHTRVALCANGHSFMVTSSRAIDPAHAGEYPQSSLCKWILTAKNGEVPAHVPFIDYEGEKAHNAQYYDQLKQIQKLGKYLRLLPNEERNKLIPPRDFWQVVALINQMGALPSYNKAVERWQACLPHYAELVPIILTMCNGTATALDDAKAAWVAFAERAGLDKNPMLSATQIVNPEQGKGANRAKADALSIGGQESFWLLEYFKYVGLYHVALPRSVQGGKDRKTYAILPAGSPDGIELTLFDTTFAAFQKEFWASSSVKMDILAVLRYTQILLEDWQGAHRSSGLRRKPSDYVQGMVVVSYKDLGSAFAVMNVATLNLPEWITQPDNPDQAQRLKETVETHLRIIGALEEKKSEEERLLRDYRDFLSSRDPGLRSFFAFMSGYASHVLRRMSKRQPVRRFHLDQLREILMANESRRTQAGMPPLRDLFENSGFQHIATAIRQSTVLQQFYKVRDGDTTYEVRYGLADDLQRHSRNRDDFMRALDEFLVDFLKENARVMDRKKSDAYRKRIPVTTRDIADLASLIDVYGAPLVANTLIAYGYARDSKDTDQHDTGDDDQNTDTLDTPSAE